jgi:hypothetical protein
VGALIGSFEGKCYYDGLGRRESCILRVSTVIGIELELVGSLPASGARSCIRYLLLDEKRDKKG